MLDFAESVLAKIRAQRASVKDLVVKNGVRDMEHYKYLMGRLEALDLVELDVKDLLGQEKEYLS